MVNSCKQSYSAAPGERKAIPTKFINTHEILSGSKNRLMLTKHQPRTSPKALAASIALEFDTNHSETSVTIEQGDEGSKSPCQSIKF